MHNFSDKEIDRLSREAAEHFESTPSTGMWDQILLKLDAEIPVQKKDKRRFFWFWGITGSLLMILLTTGIYLSRHTEKNTAFLQPALLNHVIPEPVKKTSGEMAKPNMAGQSVDQTNKSTEPGHLPSSSASNKDVYKKEIKTSQENQQTLLTAGQTEQNQNLQDENFIVAEKNQQQEEKVSVFAATNTDSLILEKNEHRPDSSTAIIQKVQTRFKKQWEISMVSGPDFSNVAFSSPDKTGFNFGFILGYRFSKRLSIQTGLLYSQKHYTSAGDSYQTIPGYPNVNPNLKMQKVQANCFMWDLPLNIRYDWLLGKKQRAFITTGLSSYFMKKEDLHYYYTWYNNPGYKNWVNENNSQYWLAAINLSAGVEQRISPVFSVQAEPFIKIPTGPIGYGKVNLNSLGIFFSLKYSPSGNLFTNPKKVHHD